MGRERSARLAGPTLLIAMAIAAALLGAGLRAAPAAAKEPVWLCKPGLADNPCRESLSTTVIDPGGATLAVKHPKRSTRRRFDCFYVYPTVSDDESTNSDLSIDPEERSIALYQASRYSQRCRVYAPMYRQITLGALFGDAGIDEQARETAYRDVLRAWRYYLRHYNHGRGVVLIGHSQGTVMLKALIADRIDHSRRQRRLIISALLLGGNVLVDEGKRSGGDLRSLDACGRARQFGCVVAFSTFQGEVPEDAGFGRPGSLLGGDPETQDVLCTNPARLRGGRVPLRTIVPADEFAPGTTIGIGTGLVGLPTAKVETGYVQLRDAYSGRCSSAGDADVLQLKAIGPAPQLVPIPDDTWGLHLLDANIALGDLIGLVNRQAHSYRRAQRR